MFVALSHAFTDYSFVHDEVLIAAFLYYFIGLVISRVGSLAVEPALKKLGIIKFADYGDFADLTIIPSRNVSPSTDATMPSLLAGSARG